MKERVSSILTIFFFLALLTAVSLPAVGQDYKKMRRELIQKQKETRSEINAINEQILKYEERLELAEEKYDRLYSRYEDLKRLIALQRDKINKLEREQNHIEEEISITENELSENRERLEILIENYKQSLSYVYKYGRTSQLALILSANSINQMLIRAYYLNKFEAHRQRQASRIRDTREELQRNKTQLVEAREKNANLLAEIQSEVDVLSEKKNRQEKNVQLLRENKRQIQNQLEEARRQRAKMDNTLTSLILEEERVRKELLEEIKRREEERKRNLAEAKTIEDEEERAAKVAEYSEPIRPETFLDEETLDSIEQSFASQKGTLRWPVESGTISEHFGQRQHPVYGTITENLGVEIVTKPKDIVRVVHDGYVTDVIPITGYGDVVLVSHGDYKTIYGNLSQVMVRKNSILKAGDIVGLSGDENSAKGESVFFMVRKGNRNLDPEDWLANK